MELASIFWRPLVLWPLITACDVQIVEMREKQPFDICTSQDGWGYSIVTSKPQYQWPTAKKKYFSLTLHLTNMDCLGALLSRSLRDPGWERYHLGIYVTFITARKRLYGAAHTGPQTSAYKWHNSLSLIFHGLRQITCPWLTESNREVNSTLYLEGWEPNICELLSWLMTTIVAYISTSRTRRN